MRKCPKKKNGRLVIWKPIEKLIKPKKVKFEMLALEQKPVNTTFSRLIII